MVDPDTGEIRIRPFADFLTERGKTHRELGDGLHDLINRVRETGKKGTIVLAVKVEPMKGDRDQLIISDEITLKLPEHERAASIYFVDDDGNPTRHDPRQMHLPLRGVEPAPATHPQHNKIG
jgi:hypothetical protein